MSTKMEWKPIETCPKGDVLLYWPAIPNTSRGGSGIRLFAMIAVGYKGSTPNRNPTHWMPLPPPPADEVSQ